MSLASGAVALSGPLPCERSVLQPLTLLVIYHFIVEKSSLHQEKTTLFYGASQKKKNRVQIQEIHSEFDYSTLLFQVTRVIMTGSLITDMAVLRSSHVVLFKAVDFDWVRPDV